MSTASLATACQPRSSVFDRGRSDTVAEIADLPKLNARAFFAETHVTEGMGVLLRQVFDRLMGRSDQGVFRLKQAMGGGNTHNLLAAALLAREPVERKAVLQRIGVSVDDRPVRVAAFSGRETDTSDYLWVTLFRALKCDHRWQPSNQVPGPSTWANVLGDEPALVTRPHGQVNVSLVGAGLHRQPCERSLRSTTAGTRRAISIASASICKRSV